MTGNIVCFTSFTFSYLAKARVLAQSMRRHNPAIRMVALITDEPPPQLKLNAALVDFDEVVYAHELDIPDFKSWLFQHELVEVSTAVKGPFLHHVLNSGIGGAVPAKVIYLDPDIAVFSSFGEVLALLDEHSIVVTPHQCEPDETEKAITDNEICTLAHGIFNLGFIAVRNDDEGRRFAQWWRDRLLDYCFDDIPRGLFTDQKWCNLIPCFFERVKILRDPGYNVASWNLSRRKIKITRRGAILVNGRPLRFYHFTKLGPVADAMTFRYAGENTEVYEIWRWYKASVERNIDPAIADRYWHYGTYANGRPIEKRHRTLYRERVDLQRSFPDPFRATDNAYLAWLKSNEQGGASRST
jgi:hypothetical protein